MTVTTATNTNSTTSTSSPLNPTCHDDIDSQVHHTISQLLSRVESSLYEENNNNKNNIAKANLIDKLPQPPSSQLEEPQQQQQQQIAKAITSTNYQSCTQSNLNGSSNIDLQTTENGIDDFQELEMSDLTNVEPADLINIEELTNNNSTHPQIDSLHSLENHSQDIDKSNKSADLTMHDDVEKVGQVKSRTANANAVRRKRAHTSESSSGPSQEATDEDPDEAGRGKRRRTQTKLFQVGDAPEDQTSTSSSAPTPVKSIPDQPASKKKKSRVSSSPAGQSNLSIQETSIHEAQHGQDVIHYEKNDYLAIRNEHDHFYLCQLTHTVRSARPFMTVKWLDTEDDGKTYRLTHQQDKIPQKSVIMPVDLKRLKSEKKGEQLFSLADDVKEVVMERLKRSLVLAHEDGATSNLLE